MNKRRFRNGLSVYSAVGLMNLFVLGMFVAILFPEPEPIDTRPLASTAHKRMQPEVQKIHLGIPTRVIVPSVGIDLPVRTGSFDAATRSWTLDYVSAFYADLTVPANDSNGSTLIYAHAEWGLFAKLPDISEGATAQVYTDSGKVFSYVYQSSRQVRPDDTSIFVNSGAPMLTLQTCSGPFDKYRTLVSFNLSGVSS